MGTVRWQTKWGNRNAPLERDAAIPLVTEPMTGTEASVHPNEFDRRRVEKALEKRVRYRYVTPEVHDNEDGYLIQSSCCSRNIDPDGGVIDIARIQFRSERGVWWLYFKDHEIGHWIMHGEYASLTPILDLLIEDPKRRFWQ
jgi:hypothetical protein